METFTPPDNFAMVDSGIYRSGFPKKKNFSFLKRIGLKTIVYMCEEEYPNANIVFLHSIGARLRQVGVSGNKEPFVDIPEDKINTALRVITDPANHPVLVHCNKGKHRTGCVIGCLRKRQKWSMSAIFAEYQRFAYPKQRFMDTQFIELFQDEEEGQ